MMRVGKYGHASLVVTTERVNCFVDPVLIQPFDSHLCVFDPAIEVDASAARELCNAIVISHEHMDHFCVRSLAELDRDTVVFYPRGASLIAEALHRLGYAESYAVDPFVPLEIDDLELIALPSAVPFPEIGLMFRAAGRTCINLADSVTDDAAVVQVRALTSSPEVLLAPYQPLVQAELMVDSLGSSFPAEKYDQRLRTCVALSPVALVPTACGIRYATPWLNDRGFPLHEEEFLADISRVRPDIRGLTLAPGDLLDIADLTIDTDALPFMQRLTSARAPDYRWRPDAGIPPLHDDNPLERTDARLRTIVREYLDDEFLLRLQTPVHARWRARMARLRVDWQLRVVFPDGSSFDRILAIHDDAPHWNHAPSWPKLALAITASGLVGLLHGELNPDRVLFGGVRRINKLYEVSERGVTMAGGAENDDPLLRTLLPDAARRYVDHELRQLGV